MILKSTPLLLSALAIWIVTAQTDICHAAETIRINGSGNALDMMKPLIGAYIKTDRDVRIAMGKPLGSSGALKALLAGALDMAVVSRDLVPEESAKGARIYKYGKTPLAIVTAQGTGIRDITTRQLVDIYSGTSNTWPDGGRIRLILRPLADIDTKIMRTLSSGMDRAVNTAHNRPGMRLAVTDPESYEAIMKTPGGIGATGMNSIISEKLPLTVLSLNGVRPSMKTLANGTYPLVKEISFATISNTTPAARKFIHFIYSPDGRAIAGKEGVLVTGDPLGYR